MHEDKPTRRAVDESKQADIENLGRLPRALGDGQSLEISRSRLCYMPVTNELDQLVAQFTGVSPTPMAICLQKLTTS